MRLVQIHPEHPAPRLLQQAAEVVRQGALLAMPTDASYVLACALGFKETMERIREIRQLDERHHFTLMARDLSEIAQYSKVDNRAYRLLKATTPGAYVFILEGSKELPRRVMHPKRKTIGVRIPHHAVAQGVLKALDAPMLSVTLHLPEDAQPLTEGFEIAERLEHFVDWVLDSGHCGTIPTTIVDLTAASPQILRRGLGDCAPFESL